MLRNNAFERIVGTIIAWLTDGAQPSKTAAGPRDTTNLSCCNEASWVPEFDLDQAGGFEFMLGKCDRCGTPWMDVYCTATSIGAYEPVSPSDVERMRAFTPGPERKAFMRDWVGNNT